MRYVFFSLFSILTFNLALAIGPDPILEKRVKEHEEAYKTLEKELPNLIIYSHITYDAYGVPRITYSYGGTKGAMEAKTKYSDAFYKLINRTYYNAMGNGFIIGAITAILNRNLSNKRINIYTIILPTLASIIVTIHDNKKIGQNPFFDTVKILKSENLFSNTNINSFGRTITATGSSILSYFGAEYALDKINWTIFNKSTKIIKIEELN